jgi:hypothetical protein
MRTLRTALIAAAMLAGGMGIAVAQTSTTTTTSPPGAASSGKCWDSVTKQVRAELPSTPSGSSTSGMSGSSTSSTATTTPGSSTKPTEAAGLPDCK